MLRINLFLTNFGRDHIRTSQFQIFATSWDKLLRRGEFLVLN